MFEFNASAPLKVLIEDLKNFEKLEKGWVYKFSEKNISININKVLIQGEIIKTSGFSNEILIIHDGTGKAKVTTRPQVPGDISWVNAGTQCSIVGSVVENGKLPLIIADKIAKISNQILVEMWPLEVKELRGVLTKEIVPRSYAFCKLHQVGMALQMMIILSQSLRQNQDRCVLVGKHLLCITGKSITSKIMH